MLFSLVTGIALTASLLPFVPQPHGIFRAGEFPRVQIAIVAAIGVVLALLFLPDRTSRWIVVGMGVVAIAIQAWYVRPFTPFARRRVRLHEGGVGDAPRFSLLASNVKLSNRDYDAHVALVLSCDPDIAVFMEVDEAWVDALEPAIEHYPHRICVPQDTGYGMLMVSRVEMTDHEVRYLLNEEVPSFHVTLRMSDPRDPDDPLDFRMIAVHPEPPVLGQDTIGRDAEIARVGMIARGEPMPIVVFGDLNDVAWSRTTQRFLRLSRLLDPRQGRGQFNSFDARYPFARWPLDHIFVSPHFEIVSIRRMPFTGSDHYPMYYELALTERGDPKVDDDSATTDDIDEARALIEEEEARERRPIGVDWENQ